MLYKVKFGKGEMEVGHYRLVERINLGSPHLGDYLDSNRAEDETNVRKQDFTREFRWDCTKQKLTRWGKKDPIIIPSNIFLYPSEEGDKPNSKDASRVFKKFQDQFGTRTPRSLIKATQKAFGTLAISRRDVEEKLGDLKKYDCNVTVSVTYMRLKEIVRYPNELIEIHVIFSVPDYATISIHPQSLCTEDGKKKLEFNESLELSISPKIYFDFKTEVPRQIKEDELKRQKKNAEYALKEAQKKLDEIEKRLESVQKD